MILFNKIVVAFFLLMVPLAANSSEDNTGDVELDRYGFEKVDKTVQQERLVKRFSNDKARLDHAIDNTKALILQSHGKPYMPELYLRLAELYIEKSRVVYFLRRTEGGAAIKSSIDSLETNALKGKAIEVYQRILNNYPKFKYRGKVHFYLAHEYRELNRLDEMVAQYKAIVVKYRQSEYVPESYLLLGDYYFNHQKLKDAHLNYENVLNYPKSSAITIARYKLAWVYINKKEYPKAIALLEKSVKASASADDISVDTYSRVDVRLEALNDIAFIYTDHYKKKNPKQTLDYFREYAWSRPVYLAVLEKLAYRYLIKKKWSHAAAIYRELAVIQHEPKKLLEYAENLYTTTRHLKDYSQADFDVRHITTALKRVRYSIYFSDVDKANYTKTYEVYARDIATQLHDFSKSSKTTTAENIESFSRVADAYEYYLDFFDNSKVRLEMQINHAESLFLAKRFVEAGKKYEELSLAISDTQKKESYLYSATLSYYLSLKENREDLNYYEVVQSQSGLVSTGQLYASNYPSSKNTSNVLFNVAWIKYDEGKYDEAVEKFLAFVDRYPNGKEADAAVQLSVDAFHAMEDYEGLIEFGLLIAKHKGLGSAIKSEVAKIVATAESKVVSNLTVASMDDWETGKDDLLEYAQSHESSSLGEAALKALFISSKEKNDIESMQIAGNNYINKYPKSKESKNVLNVMIEAAIRTNQYRVLVDNLEDYASVYPTDENAVDFLYQAARIREDMKQYGLARNNYNSLLTKHNISQRMRKDIVLGIVKSDLDNNEIPSAIKILEANRKSISNDSKFEFDARLSSLYQKMSNPKKAGQYEKYAINSFKKGNAVSSQNASMSEMIYLSAGNYLGSYYDLQLTDTIDEKIFARKTKLYEYLQKRLYSILDYKSPKWSILACYRLYEVNVGYANFLTNAPLPDMSQEEQAEYRMLIAEQAQQYIDEASQYLETGNNLAQRLHSFDPLLRTYENSKVSQPVGTFLSIRPSIKIGVDAFQDSTLRDLHNRLSRDPKDKELQLALAKVYLEKEDTGQAKVIANNLIDSSAELDTKQRANLFSLLASTHLRNGDDLKAREALEKAIEIDPDNLAVKVQLAALYQHYGLIDLAEDLYQKVPAEWAANEGVNQKAKQIFMQRRVEKS